MKAPNVVSVVAMLGVVLPAVILAISQQFPPEVYWWAALVVAVLGGVLKALQVWASTSQAGGSTAGPNGAMSAPAGAMGAPAGPAAAGPSKLRAVLLQ